MKYFLFILIIFLFSDCLCQNDSSDKNALIINLGPGILTRQDLIFSPFIHSDLSLLNTKVRFIHTGNLKHEIKVEFSSWDPLVGESFNYYTTDGAEEKTAHPHSFMIFGVDYSLTGNISTGNNSSVRIGGVFTNNINVLNYNFGGFGNFGYLASHGIGPEIQYEAGERHKIHSKLSFPLVFWLSRSPYLANDDEYFINIYSHNGFKTFVEFLKDGKAVTFINHQQVDFDIEYRYVINNSWDLSVGYFMEMLHSTEPKKLTSFQNSLLLGVIYNF